jgi:hypothetical protein
MAELSETNTHEAGKGGLARSLSRAMLRRAAVTIAATAATAGTAYLTKKWEEKVLPRIREKGGGRAVAKEALDTVSEKLNGVSEKVGGHGSGALSAVSERLGTGEASSSSAPGAKSPEKSDEDREEDRRERRRRREQRQRALQRSGSS